MPCSGCGKRKKRGGALSREEKATSIQFIIDDDKTKGKKNVGKNR